MPTLNWIGKEAVVNHHLQVPFHLLKDVPDLACGEPGDRNLIVQGDNLVALKALLPYYAGPVKCIYIRLQRAHARGAGGAAAVRWTKGFLLRGLFAWKGSFTGRAYYRSADAV